jgi:selT/selW/selH-like putative selenoprotein
LAERFSAQTELLESAGGVYEVVVDGQLVYSKKATGAFPDEELLLSQLAAR